MVRLPRNAHANDRKPRRSHDIESTVYTVLLVVAAVLLVSYVFSVSRLSTGLWLPPSAPIMTALV